MSTGRRTAAATALLLAALAAAGCGLGPGDGLGDVSITVSRDYGAEPLLDRRPDAVSESDTVMRVLDRNAEISTRFGGGFVQAIDGLEAVESIDSDPFDWFYFVNGVEATTGAAEYSLHGGEAIWWDYRDWSAAMRVPAVVGSWPQPFRGGYDGRPRPVAVECRGGGGACGLVRERLEGAGARVASGSPQGAIRILVGPWSKLRSDPAAAQIEDGPQASGVFAEFSLRGPPPERVPRCRLETLDASGRPLGGADAGTGLVAATRRYDAPPVWVVTGCDEDGVAAAASALDQEDLRDRYAVLVEGDGDVIPLPRPGARTE